MKILTLLEKAREGDILEVTCSYINDNFDIRQFTIYLSNKEEKEEYKRTLEESFIDNSIFIKRYDKVFENQENCKRLAEEIDLTFNNGNLYIENKKVDLLTTEGVLNILKNSKNYNAVKKFLEKLYLNTDIFVREQLLGWLYYMVNTKGESLTITEEGNLIGYKGVRLDNKGNFISSFTGTAYTNGELQVNTRIRNNIGDIVEMPRESVTADPKVGCSYGLHVGTFSYAKGFASHILAIEVNPTDIVSVPVDCEAQKIRTCKYKVLFLVEKPFKDEVLTLKDSLENISFIKVNDNVIEKVAMKGKDFIVKFKDNDIFYRYLDISIEDFYFLINPKISWIEKVNTIKKNYKFERI